MLNSDDLDDDYKNTLLTLLETSTLATNGITPEQKIQKMTECIQELAVSQVGMMRHLKEVIVRSITESTKDIDQRITDAIIAADKKQCTGCKAMKHVIDVEKQEHDKRLIEEYKKKMGETNKAAQKQSHQGWGDVAKNLLQKPWPWVVLAICAVCPQGLELVKVMLNFFSR